MRWYTQMGRRVWPHEIRGFFRDRRLTDGPTVAEFWGPAQDHEEEAMSASRPERRPVASAEHTAMPDGVTARRHSLHSLETH
jgi:hypothetical protein